MFRVSARLLLAGSLVFLTGCRGAPSDPGSDSDAPGSVSVPARGTEATFDVVTWNIQQFGSATEGPVDDELQRARARDVILGTDADLWGVQEIADASDFEALVAEMPGYAGLLATDGEVEDGARYYTGFGDSELKVGLVYKTSIVEVSSARVVLGELEYEFAGRPPVEVMARVSLGGATHDVVFVVFHAKADTEVESWERRKAAGVGLKAYLDQTRADMPVFVVADWNDDVDESILIGRDTPYRPFVDDASSWTFVTTSLSGAGETSILGFGEMIDHILASDEAAAWYEAESALVYRVDEIVPSYRSTTSDHLPVLARFRLGG